MWTAFVRGFILISAGNLLNKASGETIHLNCVEGSKVSFQCPCCPEESDDSRFKKLFHETYIVRDGNLEIMANLEVKDKRYEWDGSKTSIILNKCKPEDEGSYVWMCGRSDANTLFQLEVKPKQDMEEKQNHETDKNKRGSNNGQRLCTSSTIHFLTLLLFHQIMQ